MDKVLYRGNRFLLYGMIVLLIIIISSCTLENRGKNTRPQILRIGLIPDQKFRNPSDILQPFVNYLSKELGISINLIIPNSYDFLLDEFGKKKVDLAYFGGYTFILAHQKFKAEPLVMRQEDRIFQSSYLVRVDNPAQSLKDLQGHSFSFGSIRSTSGHLMPRYFMEKAGIVPETFFKSISYSDAHDKTVYYLKNSVVDAAVANSMVIESMYRDGKLDPDQVRVLEKSPPYSDNVWAIQHGMENELKVLIRDAFLSLSRSDPSHNSILDVLETDYFLPASLNDFTEVELAIDILQFGKKE